jgi:hypothetical protein
MQLQPGTSQLKSGIPVVSIAVVSIAVVSIVVSVVIIAAISIPEPHPMLGRAEVKILYFVFMQKFREKFSLAFRKKAKEIFHFCKSFCKNFHSECGSGFRNSHPDPKHCWMIPKNHLKNFIFGGRL